VNPCCDNRARSASSASGIVVPERIVAPHPASVAASTTRSTARAADEGSRVMFGRFIFEFSYAGG
jgi:hypothetical protein